MVLYVKYKYWLTNECLQSLRALLEALHLNSYQTFKSFHSDHDKWRYIMSSQFNINQISPN